MSYLEPPEDAPEQAKLSIVDYLRKYWFWIALICVIILLLPLFTPAAYFFWGLGSAKALFHDRLGIGESISTVFAVAFMFVYTLAIPYAARWLTHGRRNPKDIGIAFIAVLFVFASKPLLTGLLGSSFNAQTGEAQKCYSWRGETLTLSERGASGCGIDPVTGQKTSELTPEIAAILERQQHAPKPIAIDGSPIRFFDPASGRPIVWYDRAPDGSLELFNAEGFNPSTGKRLKPITSDVVETAQRQIEARMAAATPTKTAESTMPKPIDETVQNIFGSIIGSWKNVDNATRDLTRASFRKVNGTTLVHIFGACQPEDCDWGEAALDAGPDDGLSATAFYDQGFAETRITFKLRRGILEVTDFTHFKDSSGRIDRQFFSTMRPA